MGCRALTTPCGAFPAGGLALPAFCPSSTSSFAALSRSQQPRSRAAAATSSRGFRNGSLLRTRSRRRWDRCSGILFAGRLQWVLCFFLSEGETIVLPETKESVCVAVCHGLLLPLLSPPPPFQQQRHIPIPNPQQAAWCFPSHDRNRHRRCHHHLSWPYRRLGFLNPRSCHMTSSRGLNKSGTIVDTYIERNLQRFKGYGCT